MKPIIESRLDSDRYKFSMDDFYRYVVPTVTGEFEHTVRSANVDLRPIEKDIIDQLGYLCDLEVTKEEANYLYESDVVTKNYGRALVGMEPFGQSSIVTYGSKLDLGNIIVRQDSERRGGLYIGTKEDLITNNTHWEIHMMSIVSELYFRNLYGSRFTKAEDAILEHLRGVFLKARERLSKNRDLMRYWWYSEFGTRRRFSKRVQEESLLLQMEILGENLAGTSNLSLARKYNIKSQGTVAHELYMMFQALYPLPDSQYKATEALLKFRRDHGLKNKVIPLTDTFGNEKWDKDFTPEHQAESDGQRHDSGCPHAWADLRIQRYHDAGINPFTKTLMFTDGLNFETSVDLTEKYMKSASVGSGIGTEATNPSMDNLLGAPHKAVSQVMKLVTACGKPVAKVSAEPAKAQCPRSEAFLEWAREVARKY